VKQEINVGTIDNDNIASPIFRPVSHEEQHPGKNALLLPDKVSPREIVLAFPTRMGSLASASSHSHRITTRRATYPNTSNTPAPVLAEVKNSLGPRSGRGGIDCDNVSRLLAYRAGVIVGAMEVEAVEVDIIDADSERYGLWLLSDGDDEGERE